MANKWKYKSTGTWKKSWSGENIGSSLGSLTSGVTGIIQSGINNSKIKDTTEDELMIDSIGNTQFGSGSFDNLLNDFDVTNMARTNYTGKELMGSTNGRIGNVLSGIGSGVTTGAGIGGPWGALIGGVVGLAGGLGGIAVGNTRARNKAIELNRAAEDANALYLNNFNNAVSNTKNTMFNNSLLNLAARGGRLYKGNLLEDGGPFQHGGIFSNDIIIINNGGTHEQNPLEGVQLGVDPQGIPNLVEEGEVIWNDYVFSNRLKPTEEFKSKYKVKGETFADVAKKMQKESEERPNDPISKRGLEDSMMKLMIEQESLRQENEMKNNKRMFNTGGNTKLPKYVNVEEDVVDEDDSVLDSFWGGVATTPEQRLAIMENDPTNAAYKKPLKRTNSYLRYAPVLGSGLSVISDLFGNTNTPDFNEARHIRKAVNSITPIDFTPIGDYLSYNPLDPNYLGEQLGAQAAAVRRGVVDQSANPGMAVAGLLALNKSSQEALGAAYRQGLEYNQAQRERAAGFNRQTNAMNSEMALKAEMANKELDQLKFKGALAEAELMAKDRQQANAARSANLTTLFDNLGAIGKEKVLMKMVENNPSLLYDWMGNYKGSNTSACGGFLTIKNKRRKK